ncbi:glycosyltransferase [uncultured Flavobacterium sp.]|uniref:glycosyltransferase family 2 protein n=1 Tax=uncultured Flavobacterium sp. TaxID=165435 RepID=UPI0025DDB07F|nr:glycosyltransferase [uncultured Flavobacterium sp.]
MLSILIPTYNYNVVPLVRQLHTQAEKAGITFEVLIYDDGSPDKDVTYKNQVIGNYSHCGYIVLPANIGRSAIRNLLAENAKYSWLLFLDADTLPIRENFIAHYLPYLNNEEKVVYGGIKYQPDPPAANRLLRWVYGNKREALPKEIREADPYLSLLTLNFAISKSVFAKVRFNEEIPNLRYEDTLFSYDLMKAGIKVEHIANEACHLGLETSEIFIRKSEESITGLKYLLDHKFLPPGYVRLVKAYMQLKKAGLLPAAALFHSATKKRFRNNLLSGKPSLFIFDLYRLGYLCSLNKNDVPSN